MNTLNNPSSADEALHKTLIEEYMKIAQTFYYEGSDEDEQREEYAPKWADEMLHLIKQYGLEQRKPLEKILEKNGYQKCIECNDYYDDDDMTFCQACDDLGEDSGMHEWCAGYSFDGSGEYPDESAYSICKKHFKTANKGDTNGQ